MTAAAPALLAAAAVVLAGAGRARSRLRQPTPASSVPSGHRSSARDGRGATRADGHRHRRRQWLGAPRMVSSVAAAPVLAAVVMVGLVPSLALVASAVLVRAVLVRRVRRRERRARDGSFPDLVDLFRIAAAAGHPVHRCLEVVAARAPAPVRAPLTAAVGQVQRGVPLADALHALGPDLGSSGPVLTDALRAALRTGSALAPVLDRVVVVARDRRTRAAQAAARRLPITMLFPLVCCVLPAFVLLGVVPLLAGSLGSLAP